MMFGVPYHLLKKLKPSLTLHVLPYFFHSLINYIYIVPVHVFILASKVENRITFWKNMAFRLYFTMSLIAVKKPHKNEHPE